MNDSHELLFMIADEFTQLNHLQRLNIGIKLGLVHTGAACLTDKNLEEIIFVSAYKQKMLSKLVAEMQRVKNVTAKQS